MGKMNHGATIYAIWKERNNRVFSRNSLSKEIIKENIIRIVKDKGVEITSISLTRSNEEIGRR